eukprot:gene2372-2042_t
MRGGILYINFHLILIADINLGLEMNQEERNLCCHFGARHEWLQSQNRMKVDDIEQARSFVFALPLGSSHATTLTTLRSYMPEDLEKRRLGFETASSDLPTRRSTTRPPARDNQHDLQVVCGRESPKNEQSGVRTRGL